MFEQGHQKVGGRKKGVKNKEPGYIEETNYAFRMRKLTAKFLLTFALIIGSANNLALSEEEIYIQKQSEFDIYYYAYPDHYYGDLAASHFWIWFQIRGHQKCEKEIQLHFSLIYDEKTYPLSFEQTCPRYAVTGDRGFPIPKHIQEIIKDNSRLNTRFDHVNYLN